MIFLHINNIFYFKYCFFVVFSLFIIKCNCENLPDYKDMYYKAEKRISELESKLNNITQIYQSEMQSRMEKIETLISQMANTPSSELNCQKQLSDLSMDLSKIIFERDNCVYQMNFLNSSLSYYVFFKNIIL